MKPQTTKPEPNTKPNVLLSPDVHDFLRTKAFHERTSIKALVDEACRNHYGLDASQAATEAGATAAAC